MKDSSGSAPPARAQRKFSFSPMGWAAMLFLLALAPRVPGLRLFLTSDERTNLYWAGSQFVEGLLSGDLSLTYWHFYPGVTMSWVETVGLTGAWALSRLSGNTAETLSQFVRRPILDLILAARLPYALLTAASVPAFYLLARRLLGHWVALLGALFIALDAFFLAHSRVAHGDAPVTVFMGLSVLAFLVYLQTTRPREDRATQKEGRGQVRRAWGWLAFSAVMGALAALTKAPGQFVALFVIMMAVGDWLVQSWRRRRPDWRLAKRWLVGLALWGAVFVFLFVALWPAMWVDPVGNLLRMLEETFHKVEEGHLVFFLGQPMLKPGPWFYPYVIPFRLTPVTLIGVLASVVVLLWRLINLARKRGEGTSLPGYYVSALLLWFYVVGLLLFGNLSPKKQDRYLLPLFPILDLLAAFAFVEIAKAANQQISKRTTTQRAGRITEYGLCLSLLSLLLIFHAFPVLTAYPYYLAYFNPLMGGLPRAMETTLVGWGEGMEQAAAYLNQRSDADELYVAAVPAQTFLPYFLGTGENFYTNDIAMRADYVVLYVSQVQRLAPSPEIVRYFQTMDPEHTIRVRGVPYAWVYPGPKLITKDVPTGATLTNVDFGGQLRLAGYQISNQQISESAVRQAQGSDLEVTLYWHALAPMRDDYVISVRLVTPDSSWLAQHDSWPAGGLLPTSQWQQGDYVRDAHFLELPAEVVPGEYSVQVVVYDAITGIALNEPVTVTTLALDGRSQ